MIKLNNLLNEVKISEGLEYHIKNDISLEDCVFRYGSKKYFLLMREAKSLMNEGAKFDYISESLLETDLGEFAMYEDKEVPLDFPMINEEREDYVVVDKRNFRPLMMNHRDGFYEKWSTEEKAQADADELNRAYQKTYGAVEGPHVVMYKSDYFTEKRKNELMEGKKRKLTKKPSSETSLRDWFGRKGAKGSTGGWVDCNAPDGKGGYKSCGRKSGEKRSKYPACRPTPAGCKSKGKGKKWGKKSKNEAVNYHLDKKIPLDLPMINEAEYRGKKVTLNKPKRGGSKAYYVYVKDPKSGNVKKVSFGSSGLRAKINNRGAVKSFVARHKCKQKNDKTKPGYWSCRLPRYAKSLGLSGGGGQWW
jgi:hypothetical protein